MNATDLKRRKILLAIVSAAGSSLSGCIMPPGLVIPSPVYIKATSKRSPQNAFGEKRESIVDSVARQHDQFQDALTSFRRDYLRGEGQSYETLNERVTVPYVELMRQIFSSVEKSSGIQSTSARIDNKEISIPQGATLAYTQKGYCMNKSLPAPVAGDALELRLLTSGLDADLVPIMKALGEWSAKTSSNASKTQMLTWGLMDVGTDRGSWIPDMNQEMRHLYDDVLPGASNQMIANQNGYALTKKALGFVLEKTKLNRYISTDMLLKSTQDHNASNQLLEDLIRRGHLDNSGKGIGYSTIAENIHARASGSGVLTARIEVFNDGLSDFKYMPSNYNAYPLAKKQPISPTTLITDLVLSNHELLSPEDKQKLIGIGIKATRMLVDELKDKVYDKLTDGLSKKTPGAIRAIKKWTGSPVLGNALRLAIGASPIVGNMLSAYEFISGNDWVTKEKLGHTKRLIAGLGIIPGANTLRAVAKGVQSTRLMNLSKNNLFKFVDSKEYNDMNTHLNRVNKAENLLFNDNSTEQMKTLILEAKVPWKPATTRFIQDVKSGLATL